MSTLPNWEVTGAQSLNRGITLLEASAGTGKTYNITSLIVRLVAEQAVKMREIVVVTFTRAATAELKDRIRIRLAEAVEALEGRRAVGSDEVVAMLLQGESVQRRKYLSRLQASQASLDECLISTIHGFCQRMLQQNAFESRTDFELQLMEDSSAIREEIIDDWLTANLHPNNPERFAFLAQRCKFNRKVLETLANKALGDPDLQVLPDPNTLCAAGWPLARDSFLRRWEAGWGDALPGLFEAAHSAGAFEKKGQRTYRRTRCAQEVETITTWLRSGPGIEQVAPNTTYWMSSSVQSFLAHGGQEPEHEALDALRDLLRYADRVAACERSGFVLWVREQFDRRMRERRMQSYQDLMRNLAAVIADRKSPNCRALVDAMAGRFKAALIDEFQDTDALQWEIFREIFGNDQHWLYLIGDPKQAIYGFRGANVHVYLAAKKAAQQRAFTMRRNFRSDGRIVEAFNHWMGRAGFFGEPGIDFVPMEASPRPGEPADRIRYAAGWQDPVTAPLQLRFIDRRLIGAHAVSAADAPLDKGDVGTFVPGRVAEDIVELLVQGVELFEPAHRLANREGFRPLCAGDIAVLTRTGVQATQIQDALSQGAVPSVLHGAESVLASEDALDLQRWLEALANPGHDAPARTAATSRLFGRDGTLVARVDAQDREALRLWEQWLARLVRWRDLFVRYGFLRALRSAVQDDLVASSAENSEREDVTTRLLRRADGERRLTNLWHLAELLHEAETSQRLHLPGLLAWLKRQRVESSVDAETLECRLERDDEAVAVMTMHKAKGLEFPVVFVPYLWDGKLPRADEALLLPKEDAPSQRVLDVRAAEDRPEALTRAFRETHKEQLRLLYVACTRAKFRCVLYVGHINLLETSPLAPALHGESGQPGADRITVGITRASQATRTDLEQDLMQLASAGVSTFPDASPSLSLSPCERAKGIRWQPQAPVDTPLSTRDFTRFGLDHTWKRHSFTSLTQAKKVPLVADIDALEGLDRDAEPMISETDGSVVDERQLPQYTVAEQAPAVPLALFPSGAEAGTFLHAVFEKSDFEWAHPVAGGDEGSAKLAAQIDALLVSQGWDVDSWSGLLHKGMVEVLRTPMGGVLGDCRLCDISRRSRFDEFRFDFPVAGGNAFGRDRHTHRVTSAALFRALALRGPSIQPHDTAPIRDSYLEGLPSVGSLAGFMTGSMDLVFRHDAGARAQWFLVDYKSNRLDPYRRRTFPVDNYCLEGMRFEMEQHHYYLQYHLYVVALHRYLRVRLGASYDYERDFGGVYYLFFRGMIGEQTPCRDGRRHGSFYDKPPFVVIDALDRLFDDPSIAMPVLAS